MSERPNIMDNGIVRPMNDAEYAQWLRDIASAPAEAQLSAIVN